MTDVNGNGISDEIEIANSQAHKADAEVEKAKLTLELAKLNQQPLYDRIVMRLVVPFALAFAAPVATYYFSSRATAGLEHVERLDRAVERLEKLVVEREIRFKLGQGHLSDLTGMAADSLASDYVDQVQQQATPPDLDQYLEDRATQRKRQ